MGAETEDPFRTLVPQTDDAVAIGIEDGVRRLSDDVL
jgi:hypothetical protein